MKDVLSVLQNKGQVSSNVVVYQRDDIDTLVASLNAIARVDTILFDMDGVAADWRQYAADYMSWAHDINLFDTGFDWFNKNPKCNEWCEQMYTRNPSMFRYLPVIPRFRQLFSQVTEIARDREIKVGWLSAIDMRHPTPHTVMSDKLYWIGQNFGHHTLPEARFVFGSEAKVGHANVTTLLIEDYPKNHRNFTAAGGKCILLDSEDGNYNVDKALTELRAML